MTGGDPVHPLELLSDYLDDELSVEERSRVDRHLAECESCRGDLAALERLARAVGAEATPPAPLELAGRIRRALDEATVRPAVRRRSFVPATIAATVAMVGLLVVVSWRQGEAPMPAVSPDARSKADAVPSPAPAEATRADAPAGPPEGVEQRVVLAPDEDLARAPADAAPPSAPPPAPEVKAKEEDEARDAVARQRPEAFAKSSVPATAAPSARIASPVPCGEGYADTGLRVRWPSPDAAALDRELAQIARDVGGGVVGAGLEAGAVRTLLVPRDRFEEVFFALRARGLSGLDALPTLVPGAACAGVSIVLDAAGEPPR